MSQSRPGDAAPGATATATAAASVAAHDQSVMPLRVIDIHDRQNRAEAAVADLLTALGRDVTSEHLAETPRRVAASLFELLAPRDFTMTTFPNEEGYEELVLVRDIPFHSLCEHHLLPFRGVAHVGYVPRERLVGLSKLARVVELFSRDLQVQERLTKQIAGHLDEQLTPRGVGVVLEAEHLCMSLRGVQTAGTTTITSTFTGVLAEDAPLRRQFHRAVDDLSA